MTKLQKKMTITINLLEALHKVNVIFCQKKIAGDGEGATALFEVKIVNGSSKEQAVTLQNQLLHQV